MSVTKEIYDGAIPSGNSVAILTLLRVAKLTTDTELEKQATKALTTFSGHLERMPSGFPFLLMGLDFAVGPTREITLSGTSGREDLEAMLAEVRGRFLPRTVLALHPEGAVEEVAKIVPFLAEQKPVDGKATFRVPEGAIEVPLHIRMQRVSNEPAKASGSR